MTYYKIYNKDGVIVDVNHLFFRYQPKFSRIINSEVKTAQLISSSDGTEFYTTSWLYPLSYKIPGVTEVKAEIISEEEYNKLYNELQLGFGIKEEEVEEIQAASLKTESVDVEEKVMTVNEMRIRIKELETIVKQLLSKF